MQLDARWESLVCRPADRRVTVISSLVAGAISPRTLRMSLAFGNVSVVALVNRMFFKSSHAVSRWLQVLLCYPIACCPVNAQRMDWQTAAGSDGGSGLNNGPPSVARFSFPHGILWHPSEELPHPAVQRLGRMDRCRQYSSRGGWND